MNEVANCLMVPALLTLRVDLLRSLNQRWVKLGASPHDARLSNSRFYLDLFNLMAIHALERPKVET